MVSAGEDWLPPIPSAGSGQALRLRLGKLCRGFAQDDNEEPVPREVYSELGADALIQSARLADRRVVVYSDFGGLRWRWVTS